MPKECINSFQINQRHVFPQNHFIETGDKVCIEESAVEDGQTETSPYKFEIAHMVGINAGGINDLVIVGRIFKQAIDKVEDRN
jgi:hypothetical protein